MKQYILIGLMMIILMSCAPASDRLSLNMPGIPLSMEEMNQKIMLAPLSDTIEFFQAGGPLEMDLWNTSEGQIVFPSNFNIHIFIDRNGEWSLVENAFHYAGGEIRLYPAQDYRSRIGVPLDPLLSESDLPATLRVIVMGKMDQTNQPVGAYIDLTLPRRNITEMPLLNLPTDAMLIAF